MLSFTYLYRKVTYSTTQGESTALPFEILNPFPIHTMWELSSVLQMDFLLFLPKPTRV